MICVDASVAIKWLFEEQYSPNALALLLDASRRREEIIAPPLLAYEVTNAVRRRHQTGRIGIDECQMRLADFLSQPVVMDLPTALHLRALAIAYAFGLPATYDAHYLALAEYHRCDFWTDDRRLLGRLAGRLPFVRWLGDYPLSAA